MANENRGLIVGTTEWSTTDKSAVLRDQEQGWYNSTGDGTFYMIGDGTRTLQQIYDADEIMGGVLDSTNFDARITALIGSSTKGIVDQKNGYRGSLATNPTSSWSAGTYLAGATVENADLYFYLFNAASSTTEPAVETEWEISPDIQTASKWSKSITTAGMGSLSDPKSGDFKNYYKIGEYEQNGAEYDLFRINVAGQVTSTSATDFYKLIDASDIKAKFSSFVTDHYELEDYRGAAISSGDASGGDREENGTRQEDQLQGFQINVKRYLSGTTTKGATGSWTATAFATDGTQGSEESGGYIIDTSNAIESEDSTGTPRVGEETRMKNVANGCGCVHVFIARGTITSISG